MRPIRVAIVIAGLLACYIGGNCAVEGQFLGPPVEGKVDNSQTASPSNTPTGSVVNPPATPISSSSAIVSTPVSTPAISSNNTSTASSVTSSTRPTNTKPALPYPDSLATSLNVRGSAAAAMGLCGMAALMVLF